MPIGCRNRPGELGEWAERWYKTTAGFKSSTQHTYRQLLDYQILATFQKVTLAGIDPLLVREWLAALVESELSPSRIRNAHQVLSQVLATAVEANRLARNPATEVRLPRIVRRELHFLTAAQVEQLADSIAPPFPCWSASTPTPASALASWPPCGLAVWTCSVGAARWSSPPPRSPTRWCGERPRPTSGARCGCPDSCANSSASTWPTGPMRRATWCSPCRRAGPLREPKFAERYFKPAALGANLPTALRVHDLRHTCASLLIREGTSIKAVQHHLGHKSASITLDRYGHLFPEELDHLADRLDRVYARLLWTQRVPTPR